MIKSKDFYRPNNNRLSKEELDIRNKIIMICGKHGNLKQVQVYVNAKNNQKTCRACSIESRYKYKTPKEIDYVSDNNFLRRERYRKANTII
jgi:hypothetical protein